MPVDVITPSNSRTTQYSNGAAYLTFLLTEGAYIIETKEGYPAFYFDGGHLNGTFSGSVISGGDIAGIYLGVPLGSTDLGFNNVTVTATGLVQGYDGVAAFDSNNTVTNAGVIHSTANGEYFELSRVGAGVYALGDNNRVNNSGSISGYHGLYLDGSANIVDNNGSIFGTFDAIYVRGSATITNSGSINGGIAANSGACDITNYGTITGETYVGGTEAHLINQGSMGNYTAFGQVFITNSGTLASVEGTVGGYISNALGGTIGRVEFALGENDSGPTTLGNDGVIGTVTLGMDDDRVTNTGSITQVSMQDGANTLTNSGTINSVQGGAGADSVDNTATIGSLTLVGGANIVLNHAGATISSYVFMTDLVDTSANLLINHGTIGTDVPDTFPYPNVFFGDGADTLTNTGTIYGSVGMSGGDDIVDTSDGAIIGKTDLGAGNDTYTGGDGVDRVEGGAGNDVIDFGDGKDVYRAGSKDGNDVLDGGDGIDTYNAAAVTQAVTIDLGNLFAAKGAGNDTVLNFENAVGGKGDDTIAGSDAVNKLEGGAGADYLFGADGNDRLTGSAGADTIEGGAGRDVMTGDTPGKSSAEADIFVFRNGDSGATASTRDVITDFTDHGTAAPPYAKGADTIDLSAIDADTTKGGNQTFSFNTVEGAAFSGTAGSLVWEQFGGYALVLGDTNGDKVADFAIQLTGTHALQVSDFVL